jgi:hypothetical protein
MVHIHVEILKLQVKLIVFLARCGLQQQLLSQEIDVLLGGADLLVEGGELDWGKELAVPSTLA